MALFPWYAYLFLGNRGKPAVHMSALAHLDNKALAANCPPAIKRLIERVKVALEAGLA
jgi:putative ATP-dependent endonuclease of OLD family